MIRVIEAGMLFLVGFMLMGAVLCMGGNWVQGWIVGIIPAVCFWLSEVTFPWWCIHE